VCFWFYSRFTPALVRTGSPLALLELSDFYTLKLMFIFVDHQLLQSTLHFLSAPCPSPFSFLHLRGPLDIAARFIILSWMIVSSSHVLYSVDRPFSFSFLFFPQIRGYDDLRDITFLFLFSVNVVLKTAKGDGHNFVSRG
jgi:hypothetical protein